MARVLTILAILLMSASGISGCEHFGLFSTAIKGDFKKPTLKFLRLDSADVSFERMTLKFVFEITNPNDASIALAGYDAKFAVEGIYFLESKSDTEVVLPEKQATSVTIPITIVFAEMVAAYRQLGQVDDIGYSLQGGVRLRGIVLEEIRIPLGVTGRLPIPKRPSISLSHIQLKDASLREGMNLELQFHIENPNIIDLTIDETSFDLIINRLEVARCGLPKSSIPKKEHGDVPVTVTVQSTSVIRTLLMALAGEHLDYAVRGDVGVTLGSFPPWQYHCQFEGRVKSKE